MPNQPGQTALISKTINIRSMSINTLYTENGLCFHNPNISPIDNELTCARYKMFASVCMYLQ